MTSVVLYLSAIGNPDLTAWLSAMRVIQGICLQPIGLEMENYDIYAPEKVVKV